MLSDLIAGVIEGLYNVINIILNKGHKKETVEDHIVKNEIIQERLNNLLHFIGCDRISIWQYHNGGYYYTGLPMQKFSCTYETVSNGISVQLSSLQNKLVSESPSLHSTVIKEGEYFIADVNLIDEEGLKQALLRRGVKSMYVVGIWDIKNNLVGLIGINYVMSLHSAIADKDKNAVKDFAKIVSGYLKEACELRTQSNMGTSLVAAAFLITAIGQILYMGSLVFNFVRYLLHI